MIKKLPKDWKWVKIGEVCNIHQGYGFPKELQGIKDGGYPFYKVGDISKNVKAGHRFLELCDNFIDEKVLLKLKAKPYPLNTIVFAKIGEALKLNRRAIIKKVGIVDNNAIGLKAIENLCNDLYLFHFFTTIKLEDYSRATTVPSVRKSDIEEINFPLPPLTIQQAIVSKIEELFSELDKGIENLRMAQQQLKTYRQSVLKWAFEGKLTNENVKEGELPEGWINVKLGAVTKKISIKVLPVDFPEAKFIGMDCIEPHTLKPAFLYDFKEFKSAGNYFKLNQILYGRMRPYLNKVYRAEFEGACSGEFIILDCDTKYYPDLLKYILHSKDFVNFANRITTGDRPRISYEEISDYNIPLPPKKEQHDIVQGIENRLSMTDKMEESITQSLQRAEALKQSILKMAFEGRLIN